jgi:hypothetical protein
VKEVGIPLEPKDDHPVARQADLERLVQHAERRG